MSTTLVFVLIALALLGLFAALAGRRARDLPDLDPALTAVQSLDIEAFRNLVDPEEDVFLQASLPARDYRRIKRERTQAALAYVRALSQAALQFARFGDVARRSPDPALADSGKQIANNATYLRLRTLDASVQLTLSTVFPTFGPRPLRPLVARYDRAMSLLQNHNGLNRARSQAS